MKTYTVLYAEDVPHYAHGQIEARNRKAAIAKARKLDANTFGAYDADWDNAVCRRIVSLEDPDGNTVAEDIRLDDFNLERATDAELRIRHAAPDMLAALAHIERACAPGIDQSDDELESFISNVRTIAQAAIAAARSAT